MKEIKLKLFIITLISISAMASIIYTYDKHISYEKKLTLEQITSVKTSLNMELVRGCKKTYKLINFNNERNFATLKFRDLTLSGSVYQFQSIKDLKLYEFNLESKVSDIHFRGYLFENVTKKSCYGMVL